MHSDSIWLQSTPRTSSSLASTAPWPATAATWRGAHPLASLHDTGALRASSSATSCRAPRLTHQCSAVLPSAGERESTGAWAASSSYSTGVFPTLAASTSARPNAAVSPSRDATYSRAAASAAASTPAPYGGAAKAASPSLGGRLPTDLLRRRPWPTLRLTCLPRPSSSSPSTCGAAA